MNTGSDSKACAIVAAYLSAKDRIGVTFEQFAEAVKGFDVHPVFVGRDAAGAILVDGAEIHACILPFAHGKWFNRQAIAVLNGVIEKNGKATTHATTPQGVAFVERLGFEKVGEQYIRGKKWE